MAVCLDLCRAHSLGSDASSCSADGSGVAAQFVRERRVLMQAAVAEAAAAPPDASVAGRLQELAALLELEPLAES